MMRKGPGGRGSGGVLGSMRRPLTDGEVALAQAAFGDGLDYGRVRLCQGTGGNPGAHMAFRKPGVDAITLIRTIFFRGGLVDDFTRGGDPSLFMHEMTHIWQYQTMGVARFGLRYLGELEACNWDRNCLYHYECGHTVFAEAKLEAQAQIVQDYGIALGAGRMGQAQALRCNLAGSGLFGF
jgi:Domain of unknown function (DUF4157)